MKIHEEKNEEGKSILAVENAKRTKLLSLLPPVLICLWSYQETSGT
jgi:hypothetical protein